MYNRLYIKMVINIYGAGIAGLTVAHELIEKGFEVHVYEKDNEVGGMAKSKRDKYGIPTEHSWRGYAPFYFNTFELLKRIPLDKRCDLEEMSDEKLLTYRINKDGTTEIFDLSSFKNLHPGGVSTISRVKNKNFEEVWEKLGYEWHINNSHVQEYLNKLKTDKYELDSNQNIIEKFTNQSTVFDNLNRNRLSFELLYNTDKLIKKTLSINDYIYLSYKFLKAFTSDKRKSKYFDTQLKKIINKDHISKYGYNYIFDFIAGPGYGFDKNTMSYAHFSLFLEYVINQSEKQWQVMNQPTSEAWFNPWVKYLMSKGVKFHFNHSLTKIEKNNKEILKVFLIHNNKLKVIKSGLHIIAINPNNLYNIFNKSNFVKLSDQHLQLMTYNNQISFRLGFNKKINFDLNNRGFVLVDSPFNITFYPQEDHWCKNVNLSMNNNIKSLWSGTIILSYKNGYLYNKSAINHTKDELLNEIVQQFLKSKELINLIKKHNNNYVLNKKDIIHMEIYDDWYFDKNRLQTKNKKWVNDSFNEKFRPLNQTKYNNLYLTGSHCKTSINIWSMESAVESGKICSNLILNRFNKEKTKVHTHQSNCLIKFFKLLDNILYLFGLPNIIDFIIILFIVYIIYLKQKNN